jgi:hypothetical protein
LAASGRRRRRPRRSAAAGLRAGYPRRVPPAPARPQGPHPGRRPPRPQARAARITPLAAAQAPTAARRGPARASVPAGPARGRQDRRGLGGRAPGGDTGGRRPARRPEPAGGTAAQPEDTCQVCTRHDVTPEGGPHHGHPPTVPWPAPARPQRQPPNGESLATRRGARKPVTQPRRTYGRCTSSASPSPRGPRSEFPRRSRWPGRSRRGAPGARSRDRPPAPRGAPGSARTAR